MQHLSAPKSTARLAFAYFLRTGWRLPEDVFATTSGPVETKFNPNHDPTNGQFTFGSGGGSARRSSDDTDSAAPSSLATISSLATDQSFKPGTLSDGVYRPGDAPSLLLTGVGSESPQGMGGNYGAFLDPMTLDQAFPGLSNVPGGSIVTVSANILNLTAPATELTDQMSLDYIRGLYADIKSIDPSYHFDTLGFPSTLEGQMSEIDDLRWDRAAAMFRVQDNAGPMQLETLRFLQDRTDAAYDDALALAKAGRLPPALTEPMAIGNYIDSVVRRDLRSELYGHQISTGEAQSVRVQGREYDSSGTDLTYTIPDARVDDVVFDVTLTRKTPSSRQISGFFNSDFKPRAVVIVRPRQLGPDSTYIISRRGK